MTAKRGRPQLAASSMEDALAAVQNGTAPKRPRNEHELMAAGKRVGRPRSDASPTKQAAQFARYLIDCGLTSAEAVRRACIESRPPDAAPMDKANVRRYLKRDFPTVLCTHNGGGLFAGFPAPSPENRPVLAGVEDSPLE